MADQKLVNYIKAEIAKDTPSEQVIKSLLDQGWSKEDINEAVDKATKPGTFSIDGVGFIDTWKEVILTPSNFFESMPTTGGYNAPLKFVAICYLPLALLLGLFIPLLGFLFSPFVIIFSVIGVFVLAFWVQIGVVIFAKENQKNYEATVRLISYAQAPSVISWIPVIGVIASLYQLYLALVGVMKVHETSGFKAFLAYFGLSLIVGFIIIFFALLFIGIS